MPLALSNTPYEKYFEMIVKCYENEFQNVDSTRAVNFQYTPYHATLSHPYLVKRYYIK